MLSVREITTDDIPTLVSYWLDSDPDFMIGMGVDLTKLPEREALTKMLSAHIGKPLTEAQSYALIWLLDGKPVGHCNVNKIAFGQHAFMHLHLWQSTYRQKGMGSALVKLSLPYFFKNLELETLYCEPYALNDAPNRTLQKLGFTLEKEYITTPGYLNFEQPVKRWSLTKKSWLAK
mgnify:FL=1